MWDVVSVAFRPMTWAVIFTAWKVVGIFIINNKRGWGCYEWLEWLAIAKLPCSGHKSIYFRFSEKGRENVGKVLTHCLELHFGAILLAQLSENSGARSEPIKSFTINVPFRTNLQSWKYFRPHLFFWNQLSYYCRRSPPLFCSSRPLLTPAQ